MLFSQGMTGLPHSPARLTCRLAHTSRPDGTRRGTNPLRGCVASALLLAALPSVGLAARPTASAPVPASAPTSAAVPASGPLVGQRAAYDLTLTESGGNTLSANGTMTYVVHDTCTAWSSQQHLEIQSVTRNGGAVTMESDYTTLESKDGHHLVFRTVQKSNNAVLQTVSGEATVDAHGHGFVQYEKPLHKKLTLPAGTLFPMAHTAAILAAAQKGLPNIAPLLFDGTSPDGAQETYITLLGWGLPKDGPPFPALTGLPAGRVHVAFFSRTPESILPDYEIGMRYFANGVSDMLDMDFGDFHMQGTLHTLTLPPRSAHC